MTALNSVVGFNSTLQAKLQNISRPYIGASRLKKNHVNTTVGMFFGLRWHKKDRRWNPLFFAADSNKVATDSTNTESINVERKLGNDELAEAMPKSVDSTGRTSSKGESGPQNPEASNGSRVSSNVKRASLTAREKLRAARVLSRYNETKPLKSELGSKVLDAMREDDRGKKRSGLPEAPTNLFDDSKRGLPKPGLTFDFPGGFDLFLILFSVAFISTVMFTTTYIVWKAGAIHFNEN